MRYIEHMNENDPEKIIYGNDAWGIKCELCKDNIVFEVDTEKKCSKKLVCSIISFFIPFLIMIGLIGMLIYFSVADSNLWIVLIPIILILFCCLVGGFPIAIDHISRKINENRKISKINIVKK